MICCVLLASGFGRRFGSNKLLYEVNGKPMYLYALQMLQTVSERKIGGHTVRVIVVSQYAEIEERAKRMGMQAVHNPDAAEGIAASVRYGVQAAGDEEWIAFFTADQPNLRADTVARFLDAAVSQEKPMASVTSQGTPGNPTVFHCSRREELMKLSGDVGGRSIMKRHPDAVFWFEISEAERCDFDVPPCSDENESSAVDKPADVR
ncbi:MAG: NTP transferase domain-containing protein [Butyricicoccaceae bacterium]